MPFLRPTVTWVLQNAYYLPKGTASLHKAHSSRQRCTKDSYPNRFWNLTDSIVDTIECSREPELKKARAIIANIRKRKLYKVRLCFACEAHFAFPQLADETLVPPSYKEKLSVKTKDIVGYGTGLLPEDIIVQDLHLNYGILFYMLSMIVFVNDLNLRVNNVAMKEKNPVDSVHFYSKWSIEQSFPLPRNKV